MEDDGALDALMDMCEADEDNQQQPPPAPKDKHRIRKKPSSQRSTPPTRSFLESSSATATTKEKDEDQNIPDGVEKLSSFRLVKRKVSDVQLAVTLQSGRCYLPLAGITPSNVSRIQSERGMWGTIGVLTERSRPKSSSKGGRFMIWTLHDLKLTSISLFLFDQHYESYWQSGIVGSVFLVLQPVLMNSEERKGVALSSNQDTEIIYLGFAEDYGICKATRKDGTPCTMPVNKRRGKYCTFHLQQEFAKMKKSTRAALQSTEPTRFAADGKHKHLSEGTYSSASTLAKRAAGSCAMVGGGTWAVRMKAPKAGSLAIRRDGRVGTVKKEAGVKGTRGVGEAGIEARLEKNVSRRAARLLKATLSGGNRPGQRSNDGAKDPTSVYSHRVKAVLGSDRASIKRELDGIEKRDTSAASVLARKKNPVALKKERPKRPKSEAVKRLEDNVFDYEDPKGDTVDLGPESSEEEEDTTPYRTLFSRKEKNKKGEEEEEEEFDLDDTALDDGLGAILAEVEAGIASEPPSAPEPVEQENMEEKEEKRRAAESKVKDHSLEPSTKAPSLVTPDVQPKKRQRINDDTPAKVSPMPPRFQPSAPSIAAPKLTQVRGTISPGPMTAPHANPFSKRKKQLLQQLSTSREAKRREVFPARSPQPAPKMPQPLPSPASSSRGPPSLDDGEDTDQREPSPSSQSRKQSLATLQAALLQRKVNRVTDPGKRVVQGAGVSRRSAALRLAARGSGKGGDSTNEPQAPKKKFLGLQLPVDEEARAALREKRSAHADEAEEAAQERMYTELDKLEYYEATMERMKEEGNEIEVPLFQCIECPHQPVYAQRDNPCDEKGHAIRRIKGKKRFFQCKQCSNRVSVVNQSVMVGRCKKCGASKWEKAAPGRMFNAKQGDDEKLQITTAPIIHSLRYQ